ncbi:hypothetical protein MKC73_00230 [[Clostridium] innocuum]|nr:hypothetical protein [[Clostridium] innocuum]
MMIMQLKLTKGVVKKLKSGDFLNKAVEKGGGIYIYNRLLSIAHRMPYELRPSQYGVIV